MMRSQEKFRRLSRLSDGNRFASLSLGQNHFRTRVPSEFRHFEAPAEPNSAADSRLGRGLALAFFENFLVQILSIFRIGVLPLPQDRGGDTVARNIDFFKLRGWVGQKFFEAISGDFSACKAKPL